MLQVLSAAFAAAACLSQTVSAGSTRGHPSLWSPKQRIEHVHEKRDSNTTGFRYLTNKTQPYQVTSLPDIPFDLGEFYSGSVPIESGNSSRTLFFTFKPSVGAPQNSITIWLNGGPGCSSLEGFLEENGPWLWQPGTFTPVENPYSWANLTNMLWVEQPVGTGFTQGDPVATTEEEIAQDFIKFFKNWEDIFGIENYQIYITGESYAGRYVPFISSAMLNANDSVHYNLSGAIIYDPVIGDIGVQQNTGTMPLVYSLEADLGFNDTIVAQLNETDTSCGFASYRATYLTYPPPGPQPTANDTGNCNIWGDVIDYAESFNPCFNVYDVPQQCPTPSDPLGFQSDGTQPYFDRTDVKTAMHAPQDITWSECNGGVLDEDTSADSIAFVIPQVIEATNRVLIGNGDFDFILPTVGTLLAIQNMTWNGKLGLQEEPTLGVEVQKFQGADPVTAGIQRFERGLMWTETYASGHMEPEYQPLVAYKHLQWLLGDIDTL